MKCPECNSDMKREATAFMKCSNKKCDNSHFGIIMSEVKQARGVDHLLVKQS